MIKRFARWQENSGNAALSGRELPPEEVLAASQHIDATARALRAGGLPGTLRQLRVRAYLDLAQGLDPLDRLAAADGRPERRQPDDDMSERPDDGVSERPDDDRAPGAWGDWPDDDDNDPHDGEQDHDGEQQSRDRLPDDNGRPSDGGSRGPGFPASGADSAGSPDPGDATGLRPDRAPVKAVINLLVPIGTLLGWSSAPGEIPGFGLLDPQTTRDLVEAVSRHAETRWCGTIIGPDGTAAAHGCASGQHPWPPSQTGPPEPGQQSPGLSPNRGSSPAEQSAQVAEFLRRLRVEPSRIARGECDHRNYSAKYVISRRVKHLIKARASTCTAPGCNRPAAEADADHTIPWPDGPSCECNLGAPCRYHHRNKQAPGWHLDQPAPGVFRWRNPSGRTHTTYPTRYII